MKFNNSFEPISFNSTDWWLSEIDWGMLIEGWCERRELKDVQLIMKLDKFNKIWLKNCQQLFRWVVEHLQFIWSKSIPFPSKDIVPRDKMFEDRKRGIIEITHREKFRRSESRVENAYAGYKSALSSEPIPRRRRLLKGQIRSLLHFLSRLIEIHSPNESRQEKLLLWIQIQKAKLQML